VKLKSESLKRNPMKSLWKIELNKNKWIEYTKRIIIIISIGSTWRQGTSAIA